MSYTFSVQTQFIFLNTFNPMVVEFMDAESMDTEGQLYF